MMANRRDRGGGPVLRAHPHLGLFRDLGLNVSSMKTPLIDPLQRGSNGSPEFTATKAAGAASTPVIRLRGVEKTVGGQPVLHGVNLEVSRGRVTTVIGKSGGGKSVLLKHMIWRLKPDRGQ